MYFVILIYVWELFFVTGYSPHVATNLGVEMYKTVAIQVM